MKVVKFFVVFGAVLILVGLGALVTRIQDRATRPANPVPEAEGAPRMEETLTLPAGARVTQLAGLDSGAAVLVELPQGGGQMLFFSAQGKLKRRVILTPEAPPSAPRGPGS
ncbi:MAG: hypothetical protein HQL98_08895 [Magnetococcales bacterium]|nr:hypothetical protein [Magnetococcales bacterium]